MEIISELSFYDDYMQLVKDKQNAEKEIPQLENPERQLERIKLFYRNIGADYAKNKWLAVAEANISINNKGEDSRLSRLRRIVRLGVIFQNAVEKQDDESLRALNALSGSELYAKLIKQIMFYVGVCRVKSNPDFIEKAGMAVMKRYSPTDADVFTDEGVYYYVFYLQCVAECLKHYRRDPQYDLVKQKATERCMNLKLMLSQYRFEPSVEESVKRILSEISDVELLMLSDNKS